MALDKTGSLLSKDVNIDFLGGNAILKEERSTASDDCSLQLLIYNNIAEEFRKNVSAIIFFLSFIAAYNAINKPNIPITIERSS